MKHSDQIKPIFIGGCPRSGTTMLGAILGSAPNCVATPESHFKQTIPTKLGVDWAVGMSQDAFLPVLANNFRFKLWDLSLPSLNLPERLSTAHYRQVLLSLVDSYIQKNGTQKNSNYQHWDVWVDHTPQNIQDPLMLRAIFPDAKFIHIVRDPRAVAASVLSLDWGPNDAESAAIFWAQKMAYGLAFEQRYPRACFRVRYEDILERPSETIQTLCDFCEIEFQAAMLLGDGLVLPDYTKRQHALVGSLPDKNQLKSWEHKLSEWQCFVIERKLGDLMPLVGYSHRLKGKAPKRTKRDQRRQFFQPVVSLLKHKRHQSKKKKYVRE